MAVNQCSNLLLVHGVGAFAVRTWRSIALSLLICVTGCTANNHPDNGAARTNTLAALSNKEVDIRVLGLSDTFMTRVATPYNQIIANALTPQERTWALQTRVAQALAALSNATGPVPSVNLLNLVVQISLQTHSIEAYWLPTLLHDNGRELLDAYRQSETDAWELAGQAFTSEQITDLKELLAKWKRDNPAGFATGFVKLTEAIGRPTARDPMALPSSLLSLLNVNPLAGLDPVTQEAERYRMLSERLVHIAFRAPIIMQWQVESATDAVLRNPDIQRVVSTSEQYAKVGDRFNEIVARYPNDYAQATKAAIDQINAATTQQRQAIFAEVDNNVSKVHGILEDVRNSVGVIQNAGASINDNTSQTVITAEASSKRILHQATICGIIIVIVACVFPALVIFAYRCASRRWLRRDMDDSLVEHSERSV